jgi:RNA polymerase sigma factor (sigma-70 family)
LEKLTGFRRVAGAHVQTAIAVKGAGACPSMFSTPGSSSAEREFGHGSWDERDLRLELRRFARCRPPMSRLGADAEAAFPARGKRDSPLPENITQETPAVQQIENFYRAHAGKLIRQIARRAGSRDEARDVVHEAVARFLSRGAGSSAEVKRLDAYLAEASHNLLTDRDRSAARFARASDEFRSSEPQHVDQILVLEARDKLRRLDQAMHKLRPRTRAIFLAHRLHGLSYTEIAAETGLSVKGVEKQMAKAIAKLSRFLDRP